MTVEAREVDCSAPLFLRQGLRLNQKFTSLIRTGGQQASGGPCVHAPNAWDHRLANCCIQVREIQSRSSCLHAPAMPFFVLFMCYKSGSHVNQAALKLTL